MANARKHIRVSVLSGLRRAKLVEQSMPQASTCFLLAQSTRQDLTSKIFRFFSAGAEGAYSQKAGQTRNATIDPRSLPWRPERGIEPTLLICTCWRIARARALQASVNTRTTSSVQFGLSAALSGRIDATYQRMRKGPMVGPLSGPTIELSATTQAHEERRHS